MDHPNKDLASTVLRFVIVFIMGVVGFALLMLTIGFVVVPFLHDPIGEELAKQGNAIDPWQAIAMVEALIAGILAILLATEYFFLLLWRVLSSVRQGDPFAPINSQRLSRMAWISLAGYAWAFLFGIYAAWFESILGDEIGEAHITADFDFGGGGLVLILVLFVLARVFRHGTTMRDDLEGTV